MSLDPTTIRVSDTLLLSDLVGCDSVYRRGFANPVNWTTKSDKFAEAKHLGKLLDQCHQEFGPYSVSYGYIGHELSGRIVKYQDPTKPSYHRWDHGAAADVCFHDSVNRTGGAPIYVAAEIDGWLPYSRMITYSESEWMCLATRLDEGDKGREAMYENRYVGQKKPKFIKYSDNRATRDLQKSEIKLHDNHKDSEYPTYHGGGRRQFHHMRLSDHVVVSDLLYKAKYVHNGVKNIPPLTNDDRMVEWMSKAARVANVLEVLIANTHARVSVVRAYDRHKCWTEHRTPVEIVPHYVDAQEAADIICGNGIQAEIRPTSGGIDRVRFYV